MLKNLPQKKKKKKEPACNVGELGLGRKELDTTEWLTLSLHNSYFRDIVGETNLFQRIWRKLVNIKLVNEG